VDREVTLENEMPAVLDLSDGVEAGQADLLAFLLGELGSQDQGPVIELFTNDGRAEPIGSGLQSHHIVHSKEGVVILRKPIPARFSSRSMKEWSVRQLVVRIPGEGEKDSGVNVKTIPE
jgi:hypothetical protein